MSRTDRHITPRTDQCSSATAGKGRFSKEDHREKFAGAEGLGTSALATVGAVKGFVSNGSLEEKDREIAAYSGGAGEVVPDIGAAGPKGLRCAIDNEMKV